MGKSVLSLSRQRQQCGVRRGGRLERRSVVSRRRDITGTVSLLSEERAEERAGRRYANVLPDPTEARHLKVGSKQQTGERCAVSGDTNVTNT